MSFDSHINHQYMASHWSPRSDCMAAFISRLSEFTDDFRQKFEGKIETLSYGDLGPRQEMDIATPNNLQEGAPILVFIHGGYWTETEREMYLCVVKIAVEKGWIGITVGYDQAPDASMTTIVNEIREAYAFICKRFPKSRQMVIQGHSAGAHLACMVLSTEWDKYTGVNNVIPISRCILISGVYDLTPVVHIDVGEYLQLTAKEIHDFSPIRHTNSALRTIRQFGTKVVSVLAQHDPPIFSGNGQQYIKKLIDGGAVAEQIKLDRFDHFDIIEELNDREHPIHKMFLGE